MYLVYSKLEFLEKHVFSLLKIRIPKKKHVFSLLKIRIPRKTRI